MKTYILSLVVVLTLGACTNPVNVGKSNAKEAVNNITYTFDDRTKLCFAVLGNVGDSGFIKQSITFVPCTKEVMEQIEKK